MKRAIGIRAFSAVLIVMFLTGATIGEHGEQLEVVLRVGDKTWKYDAAQLRTMATEVFTSPRGKKNPAIRLDLFVTKDTKLPMDQIIGVVVIGAEKALFLEGDKLAHLKHLGLKFGDNHFTLVPLTAEAETALRPVWGKPRIESVERVDVMHSY